MSAPETVYVTEIKHGTDVLVNRTEAGAIAALYQYVESYWDAEMDLDAHGPVGALADLDAIEMYFDYVEDEGWTRTETQVGP